MLVDQLIPRLRAKRLTVHDVRGQLRRNGTSMTRPVAHIKGIAGHHDAEYRPLAYDSLKRYQAQANYHINKDWGNGAHGDGLMYHFRVDNIGDLYITRNPEEVLWQVGNENYSYVGYCLDGLNQQPTREQAHTVEMLLDVLTLETPEIAAGQNNVKGHKEIPGNATACPGPGLDLIIGYRATGFVGEANYQYQIEPSPSTPIPAPPSTTGWNKLIYPVDIGFIQTSPARMYNIETGEPLWESGLFIHATGKTDIVNGHTYYIPVDRMASKEPYGFREADLNWGNVKEPFTSPPPAVVTPPVIDPTIIKARKYDEIVSIVERK